MAPTVLIVDDDDLIREVLTEILQEDGYRVTGVLDAYHAFRIIEREPPDLILLDLNLPMLSGTAFVQQYRRQAGPKAPVVLVSGDRDLRRVASELGVAGYVSKPFEMGDLLTLVRSQTGFSRRPRCASPAI